MAGNFDHLIEELGLDIDERFAKAIVDGVDGELQHRDASILSMFRKMTAAIVALSDRVEHLNAEVSRGNNLRKPAASPDQNPHVLTDDDAPGEMRKAQAVRADFLEQVMEAQKAGRVDGHDVAMVEACINSGRPVPQEILRAVMGSDR